MARTSTPHIMGRALSDYQKLYDALDGKLNGNVKEGLSFKLDELVTKLTKSQDLRENVLKVAVEEYAKPPVTRTRKTKTNG